MIIFQTEDNLQLDLTDLGLTFNEASPYFSNETESSYTFPFNIPLDSDLVIALGLFSEENISSYRRRIDGYIIADHEFYNAYLTINEDKEHNAELRLFFGKEVLSIFNKRLTQLPFPVIDTQNDLNGYSASLLSKEWPEATHNFAMVRRTQIDQASDYGDFNGYTNLRNGNNTAFIINTTSVVDGRQVPSNRNVVAPMPYVLEVLKVGFATEGLELRGDVVNHPLMRKMLFIPKKYFEFYSDPGLRALYSFTTSTAAANGIQTHLRRHTPNKNGSYTLQAQIEFPKGITQHFDFSVTYNGNDVFRAQTQGEAISINEKITINVSGNVFTPIDVTLAINRQQRSIAQYNSFVFDYIDGRVNVFPQQYSLREVMPNLRFRKFLDAFVEWLNWDVVYYENVVYINFMEDTIKKLVYEDHTEYEDPKRNRKLSVNNLFRLKYTDGTEVLVSNKGEVFDDTGFTSNETEKLDFKVFPLPVRQDGDLLTGSWPEEEADIMVGLYDGLQNGKPVLVESVNGLNLKLKSIYQYFHRLWLSFRANSEKYKDTFYFPTTGSIDLRKGIFKYNKKHLITKVQKRRISEERWKVEMETESF